MTSLDKAPASVRAWFAADTSTDPAAEKRAVLAPDVVFDFGPHKIRGLDDVLVTVGFMMPPGWLGEIEWSLLPSSENGRVTVRGLGPGGAPMLGPAGALDAVDYVFTLGADGLITGIAPQLYDHEPDGLARPLRPGDAAPAFVLPDAEGVKVALRQEGTKATVVAFISNHCPYSLAWHDRVQKVGRDYAARGVRLLQINPNDPAIHPLDGVETTRKRVAEGQFAGPCLVDEGQVVARRWGARHTPELFVLNADDVVAYHGAADADSGDESLNAAWLRGALDRILAGGTPDPATTQPVGCSIKWTRQ